MKTHTGAPRARLDSMLIGLALTLPLSAACSASSGGSGSGGEAGGQFNSGVGGTSGSNGGTFGEVGGGNDLGTGAAAGGSNVASGGSFTDNGSGGELAGNGGEPSGSGGTTGGGTGGTVETGAGGATQVQPGTFCLQAGSGDYSKAGPYAVSTMANVDLASVLPAGTATPTTYTIFYPTNMEANCPHPVIAWGNGTGVTGSQVYGFFNNNAASWGMVVIASDNSNVGSGVYQTAGVDYLMAENGDPTSPFYQKLGTRAGVSGHSQGAFGATVATSDPNIVSEVQVEGGGNPKAGISFLALSGTADNVVTTGPPTASYAAATGPSMLAIYTGADHVTTPTLAGWAQQNPGTIQFMRFYTAWFRCFLADDANACAMFKGGQSCGVCKDPNWSSIETKNL